MYTYNIFLVTVDLPSVLAMLQDSELYHLHRSNWFQYLGTLNLDCNPGFLQ